MEIKVVGPGCSNCKKVLSIVQQAVKELSAAADIIYVTDVQEIMNTGIMRTPGLIVNGKVKSMGRVPSLKDVKQYIEDEQ